MKNLLLNNLGSKIAAFFVAIAVWYLVKSSDQPTEKISPIPGTNIVPVDGNPTISTSPLTPDPTGGLTLPLPGLDTSTPPVPGGE